MSIFERRAFGRELTPVERRLLARAATAIAIPLALISLLPSLIAIRLVDREAQHRDKQAQAQRLTIKRASTISLVNQCNEIEALKFQQRAEALRTFRDLDKNLALLNIKETPQIVRAAKKDRDILLHRYKATPGGSYIDEEGRLRWHGCGNYPPPLE